MHWAELQPAGRRARGHGGMIRHHLHCSFSPLLGPGRPVSVSGQDSRKVRQDLRLIQRFLYLLHLMRPIFCTPLEGPESQGALAISWLGFLSLLGRSPSIAP